MLRDITKNDYRDLVVRAADKNIADKNLRRSLGRCMDAMEQGMTVDEAMRTFLPTVDTEMRNQARVSVEEEIYYNRMPSQKLNLGRYQLLRLKILSFQNSKRVLENSKMTFCL